jgi:hypothetical protein
MPPSVLAVIGSPYQALGLLEYVREHRISRGTAVLPVQSDLAMMRPTINVLMHLRGFTFDLRRPTGFRKPGNNTGTVAEEIAALGRERGTVDTVVIGDYRDTAAWRVASILEKSGPDVVVLDDGAATLAIDRSGGGFAPLEWSEEAERDGFMPQPAVTFFTSMPEALRAGADDTIVPNRWAWLRSRYDELPRSDSLVLLIGQGFAHVRLMDEETELEVARRLVASAHDLHPGGRPLYVAHRAESIDKLRAISEVCEVARFDVPLELVPVEAGLLPAGVVAHYSTAMTSLATLAPPEVVVHSQRIPADRLASRADYIADVYRRLESGWAGRITFID